MIVIQVLEVDKDFVHLRLHNQGTGPALEVENKVQGAVFNSERDVIGAGAYKDDVVRNARDFAYHVLYTSIWGGAMSSVADIHVSEFGPIRVATKYHRDDNP